MTRLMSAWAGVDRAAEPDVDVRTSREVESPKRLAACSWSAVNPPPAIGGGDVGDKPPSPLRRPFTRPPLPPRSLRASAWLSTLAIDGASAAGGGVVGVGHAD